MFSKLKGFFIKGGDNQDFREVLKGGSVAFVYRMLNMLVGYGIMYFISQKLGDEGIGIYNLSLAILSILMLISCLGFNTSVVRFVSQYNAEMSFSKLRKLYKSILKIIIPISFILGALIVGLAEFLAISFYDDAELIIPFRILGVVLPFSVITGLNVEFIRGLKQVHVSELFRNLGIHVVTLGAVMIASVYALLVYYPLLAYLLGAACAALYTLFYILKYFRSIKGKPDGPEADPREFELKSHLIVSLPMILTSFIQLLNGQVDTVMLGLFPEQSIGDVGIFTVALKISVITNFMIGAIKSIAMPKISELFWSKKMDNLKRVIGQSTMVIFLFAAPVSVLLMIFPEPILGLVNPNFTTGGNTLRIFAITQLFNASCGLVAVFLNMTGNQAFFTKLVLVTTTVNIILNWLLIPHYGMEGAAVATLIATVSWNFIGAYRIYSKYGIATFFRPRELFKRS